MERNHRGRRDAHTPFWNRGGDGRVRLLVALAGTVLAVTAILALPSWDPGDLEPGELIGCLPTVKVSDTPIVLAGLPVAAQTVTVDAAAVKLINGAFSCRGFMQALGPGDFAWEFDFPSSSAGLVQQTDSLLPRIKLDVPGNYTVRLRICPSGCTVFPGTPDEIDVGEQPLKQLTFETLPVLPPETVPILPASALTPAERTRSTRAERVEKCLFGGGLLDPQWVTVEPFTGPASYAGGETATGEIRAVEGTIRKSKISRQDAPWNHSSQDFSLHLGPDPSHRWMLPERDPDESQQDLVEVEWEANHLPGGYAPGNADRASVWGYRIYDCGHEPFNVEIHPPVGMAVHRPRAIRIPDTHRFPELGNNEAGIGLYVPGILTEVHFNPFAGEMMSCGRTGLHQPGRFGPPSSGAAITPITGACIEDPSPLAGRTFSFNIYLPRSPKATLEAAGVTGLPDIPLYYNVIPDGPVPQITIERREEGAVTYLHVKVHLPSDDRHAFKIVAAWVYPDAHNWGLRRWRVTLDSIDVSYDGDGTVRGDGEWNLWVAVNNASPETVHHEWTRIVNEEVSGPTLTAGPGGQLIVSPNPHTFHGRPWSTGDAADADRRLGPDLLLFPRSGLIRVHSSGYEEDWAASDSLGVVDDLRLHQPAAVTSHNVCSTSEFSECTEYALNYRILDLGAVGGALLSNASLALMDAYRLGGCGDIIDGCPTGGGVVVVNELPPPVRQEPWHPAFEVIVPGAPLASIHQTTLFKPQGPEEYALTGISVGRFFQEVTDRLATDPAAVDEMLQDLRQVVDRKLESIGPEVLLDVRVICVSLPQHLCQRYFGDLLTRVPRANDSGPRMTGAAGLGSGSSPTSINVLLPCNAIQEPSRFVVTWERGAGRTFEMDLLRDSRCDMGTAMHKGTAIGRLDGIPGGTASWTLHDRGEPGSDDRVSVIIKDWQGQVVHSVEGPVLRGNLQLHK